MKTTKHTIQRIPALVWGEPAERVWLAVHGNQSHKADTVIQLLAQRAAARGEQVLSFDLPGHGERKGEPIPCKVQNCVEELSLIMEYTKRHWGRIGLFACSLGAYFSLLAYQDEALAQCLFLSPVVDMERLIRNMMAWFHITPQQLEREGEILTPIGQTLYWDYYCYVKAHPILHWDQPTSILYGERDDLCEFQVVSDFARRFGCQLQVVEQGEHYFHTPEQLARYSAWLVSAAPCAST